MAKNGPLRSTTGKSRNSTPSKTSTNARESTASSFAHSRLLSRYTSGAPAGSRDSFMETLNPEAASQQCRRLFSFPYFIQQFYATSPKPLRFLSGINPAYLRIYISSPTVSTTSAYISIRLLSKSASMSSISLLSLAI